MIASHCERTGISLRITGNTTMRITIKGGLDLASNADALHCSDTTAEIKQAAVLGGDYPGIKPDMQVSVGDRVLRGQTLFADRLDPRVRVTSSVAGTVTAINRGPKRALTSVVVGIDRHSTARVETKPYPKPENIDRVELVKCLLDSGLWPALRERPFDRVPSPDTYPSWLFVTAMDSNPLAANPSALLSAWSEYFRAGLHALRHLAQKNTFVCHAPGAPVSTWGVPDGVELVEFAGPHPAGLPGTHMHYLAQVSTDARAWHIGYQDVVAVGRRLLSGELWTERTVAVTSVAEERTRLRSAPLGASLNELLGSDASANQQILSGPIFSGRAVTPETNYLGRYHLQISLIPLETAQQRQLPTAHRVFHAMRQMIGAWTKSGTTSLHYGLRRPDGGLLPLEIFDRVWPLQIPPVPLLRALLSGDAETAERLGCLSLAEEDLATCASVCPVNLDYAAALRRTLNTIAADL